MLIKEVFSTCLIKLFHREGQGSYTLKISRQSVIDIDHHKQIQKCHYVIALVTNKLFLSELTQLNKQK